MGIPHYLVVLLLLGPLPVVKHLLDSARGKRHKTISEQSTLRLSWANSSYGQSIAGVCGQWQSWSSLCSLDPDTQPWPSIKHSGHVLHPHQSPDHNKNDLSPCSGQFACNTCAVAHPYLSTTDYNSWLWQPKQQEILAEKPTLQLETQTDISGREVAQDSEAQTWPADIADSMLESLVTKQSESIIVTTGQAVSDSLAEQSVQQLHDFKDTLSGQAYDTDREWKIEEVEPVGLTSHAASGIPHTTVPPRSDEDYVTSVQESEIVEGLQGAACTQPVAEPQGAALGEAAAELQHSAGTVLQDVVVHEQVTHSPDSIASNVVGTDAVHMADAASTRTWQLQGVELAGLSTGDSALPGTQQQSQPPVSLATVIFPPSGLQQAGRFGFCLDPTILAVSARREAMSQMPMQQQAQQVQYADQRAAAFPLLTPVLAQAVNEQGLYHLGVLAVACLCYSLMTWLWRKIAEQTPYGLLPSSVRKDPKTLDAYFALRQAANQHVMWFRLLGVSGAAVALADRAQQRCAALAGQSSGAARFARKQIRVAVHRIEQEKKQALQQQEDMLRQQAAAEQQKQADAHSAAMAAAEESHQMQQSAMQEQIEALQKQLQNSQSMIRDLKAREKELTVDARLKADVIAEQRATNSSLHQQLVEAKSEKAGLSHELREVRDQLAKEKGRVEAMLHEEQEVKGQAQTVSTKYEFLQQQLSEVRSNNAQLSSEVTHLQAATVAAEANAAELRREKQILEEKREQLQQQLTSSNEQLSEVRSQNTEYASKLRQLQERSTEQQEQLVSLQTAQGDLSSQLQQLQAIYAAAQTNISQLQAKLTDSDAQIADGRASIAELQVQLRQTEQRNEDVKLQLLDANNQNLQLRSDLQHLQARHAAAETNISELRSEKAAFAAKADELQQRLTASAAEAAELRSQHATAVAQANQQQDANAALQEQLESAKAKNKRQSSELNGLQQQLQGVEQLLARSEAAVEQLNSDKQHLQQEAVEYLSQIQSQEERVQQLTTSLQQEQATVADLLAQLQELKKEHHDALCNLEDLDQNLIESVQLLGEREELLQELRDQKTELEGRVTALTANLEAKTATLREAQESLSETEGKLYEEYDKSFGLARDNSELQEHVDRLMEENAQMEKELEEALADRTDLLEQYEQLEASFKELLAQADDMHAKTEGLLAENLDSRVELAGKLTAAQAGLTAVTQERDELAKKLYWAEIARDQHGAAKALAAADAIAARQALTEEKLLRKQVSSPSPSPGPGAAGGSRQVASPNASPGPAASGGSRADVAATSDGKDGPDGQRGALRSNSSINSTGKWPAVKTGYLTQNIADRRSPGSSRTGVHSPRSPNASPRSPAGSSMSPLGPGSKASSAPCTPRSPDTEGSEASSPFVQHQQQLQQQQQGMGAGSQSSRAETESARGALAVFSPSESSLCNTGSPNISLLRKSASLPAIKTAALEELAVQHQQQASMLPSIATSTLQQHQSECSSPTAVGQQDTLQQRQQEAAAADNLRQNFSDNPTVPSPSVAAATGPESLGRVPHSQQQQDQQQAALPDSPQQLPPPEVTQSPSIRSSASRATRGDREKLPLALSPVPFDLTASSDIGASAAAAAGNSSPGSVTSTPAPLAAAAVAAAAAAVAKGVAASSTRRGSGSKQQQEMLAATPASPKQQQQKEGASLDELFFTPLPQSNNSRELGMWSSSGSAVSPAAANTSASCTVGTPQAQGTPFFTPRGAALTAAAAADSAAGGSALSSGTNAASSPAPSICSVRSFQSTSDLDDEADVLIGSMSDADFARIGVHRAASPVGQGSAADLAARSGSPVSLRQRQNQQQQSILAAEAAAAVAARRSGATRHAAIVAQTAAAAAVKAQQQQQRLTKNQKKKLKQKQKKQAAAASLDQQPSLEAVKGTAASMEASPDSLAPTGAAAVQLALQNEGQQEQHQQESTLVRKASHGESYVQYEDKSSDDGHMQVSSSVALLDDGECSMEDVAGGRDMVDSPPKSMFMAVSAAAAAAASAASPRGVSGGRYSSSPMRMQSSLAAAAAKIPLPASPRTPTGQQHMHQHLMSQLSGQISPRYADVGSHAATADISLASASSIGSAGSYGSGTAAAAAAAAAGSGGSRLRTAAGRSGSPKIDSPTRTSCSSIKNLVAQSRLRDAEVASSSGSSSRLLSSPQRFRAKFGVSPSNATAAASLGVSSSSEVLSPLRHQNRSGSTDQGLGPTAEPTVKIEHAGDAGPDVVVLRGSAELPMYRSSVHWKALSDSVHASLERVPSAVSLGSRSGSGCSPVSGRFVAVAAAAAAVGGSAAANPASSQEWKVAENMLYFE